MTRHGGTMLFGSGIVFMIVFNIDLTGQIIATSHDVTLKLRPKSRNKVPVSPISSLSSS